MPNPRLNTRLFARGQAFNPYGLFTGLFIPEALARCTSISTGAKIAWGRLARYAGQDGRCYPTMRTLGKEIGVGERQAQKYVAELERNKLLRRRRRISQHGQISNAFEFLWHELFEELPNDHQSEGVNDRSGGGVNDRSGDGVNDRSPKESQCEESQTHKCALPTGNARLEVSMSNKGKTRFNSSSDVRTVFSFERGTRPRALTRQQETWFAQWWPEYWLKKSKKAAREEFGRQVQTEDRFQEVMAATRAQRCEMLARPLSKLPYASTWLNGERWTDEVAPTDSRYETPSIYRRMEDEE